MNVCYSLLKYFCMGFPSWPYNNPNLKKSTQLSSYVHMIYYIFVINQPITVRFETKYIIYYGFYKTWITVNKHLICFLKNNLNSVSVLFWSSTELDHGQYLFIIRGVEWLNLIGPLSVFPTYCMEKRCVKILQKQESVLFIHLKFLLYIRL